jgi:hypothetical protein
VGGGLGWDYVWVGVGWEVWIGCGADIMQERPRRQQHCARLISGAPPPTNPAPQEGAEYDVVPGSEFTVARTATRANTSDYYVNGKKASVKEVRGAGQAG